MGHFGRNVTPKERSGSKLNSNGRLTNGATNSCQLKKNPPRKDLNQQGRGRSSSEGGCGQDWPPHNVCRIECGLETKWHWAQAARIADLHHRILGKLILNVEVSIH